MTRSRPLLPTVLLVSALASAAGCAREPRNVRELIAQVERMEVAERGPALQRYVEARGGTPIVENTTQLHFLVRDVDGVPPRVVGDFNQWGATPQGPDPKAGTPVRVAGTDWSWLEGSAYTNARIEYVLLTPTAATADPLNPRVVETSVGRRAEKRMPAWAPQPELEDDSNPPAGRLVLETSTSRLLGSPRQVQVYLPPGYETSTDFYPTLYVLDGNAWVDRMQAPRLLDRLIARKAVPPLIAVFVTPENRQEEYSRNPRWRGFVAQELVASIDGRYRTFPGAEQRAVLGSSLSAYGAVDLAAEFPSVFGGCAALAPPTQAATVIANQAHARAAAVQIRFFVLGGLYDDQLPGARRLRTALVEANAPATYVETPEGHSSVTFTGHLDEAITTVLRPPPPPG
jgi:enterochelin esterase-like enzyme